MGRVAFVVLSRDGTGGPGEVFFSEAEVPQGVLRRTHSLRAQLSFIIALEEIATSGAYVCPELVRVFFRRDVVHFADNQAANGAAVKGYSKVPDLARVVSAMHVNIAKLQARWWLSFVESDSNVADAPSRGELSWLRQVGATRLTFVFRASKAGSADVQHGLAVGGVARLMLHSFSFLFVSHTCWVVIGDFAA